MKTKKVLFVIGGSITFALAIVGIVVRGVPTTPLLLLTLMLYSKGSPTLEMRFRGSFFYRKFLEKYDKRKALTRREKVLTQLSAGIMMAVSFIFISNTILRLFLVICFISMNYVFIFKIKTYREEDKPEDNNCHPKSLDIKER